VDLHALRANPLALLQAARSTTADGLVVISETGPIFSRAQNCCAAVAVFGPTGIQQILNDAELFGTVISVDELFSLPPTLMRLNAGLFSLQGEEHKSHQQILRSVTSADGVKELGEAIVRGWESFVKELQPAQDVYLLSEMRRLILQVSERTVFGDTDLELGKLIQSYFECRRSLSGSHSPPRPAARRELIRMGGRLDRMLRRRLRTIQSQITGSGAPCRCLFSQLVMLASSSNIRLTNDQLIAHANMLFMSSSEPIAVTLTWVLLLLSQKPELRLALRQELMTACGSNGIPLHVNEFDFPLFKAVIQETLRLLPPNAIMVRLTTTSGRLLGYELPPQCEVVLSPYIEHRDPQEFPKPDTFDPYRWHDFRPSIYSYFPYGIGTRYCIGRQLANFVLLSILARILSRYDVILVGDQEVDWRINITLMPASEPVVKFLPWNAQRNSRTGGQLSGPVATLVRL
jgi:cytochrome P450